ncbi:hypothetical protein TVAG_435520 [Trichomonas vaginalis G3]|uniref:Microbial-type PARG catalytic domain-containing protein n=1 Tax=Trichomonas vaginalis (strain ATCC PRA-98 / G3) TaxID=412133 RepID=A2G2A2_TRIV3|nr:hypothetical protein TVAGG3_0555060 [Trichomonas vaginalis G3]EAX88711.1 hypothetical protein TVAG_435520 [Trichomonas vaginalis G3]KAI5520793.1 hypothetical protein TVAGG3_0555060 [Trichomonas vaginalis G3]|eukprot:XP_001301641.1 hypothetical protein [Trichomonas vaginalis G3]
MNIEKIPASALKCENVEAQSCLRACVNGFYTNYKGERVNIEDQINYCLANTKSYPPNYDFKEISHDGNCKGIIEIRRESTLDALYRLREIEGKESVCGLNFANPSSPGGGFMRSARAQEETLCRSSALYYSLIQKLDFYEYNIRAGDLFSSSYCIFSPECPTWKIGNYKVLDKPFNVSYITSAAVIAVYAKEGQKEEIDKANDEKIYSILRCAIENGVKNLVLGAYGCGAFQNNPKTISLMFKKYLIDENMKSHFDYISFSIIGFPDTNLNIFSETFGIPVTQNN